MTQDTDSNPDAQTYRIDEHNADGRAVAGDVVRIQVGDETFIVGRETKDPRKGLEPIECEVETKAINQYTLVERSGHSRSGTASSKNHHDRLLFIVRDGDRWICYNPKPRPYQSQEAGKYLPTQVDGVSVHDVYRKRGGRGHASRYKQRYKIERELVESFDDVWMIEYRREIGGSRNGSYKRIKNATATRLTPNG